MAEQILPNDAINKAYDEYLEKEKEKETKEPVERENIYCCRCKFDMSDYDYFADLTDNEYLLELDNNQYCGRSERCLP